MTDRRPEQATVTKVGGARRAGPAGAYSCTEARTRIYACVNIHWLGI